MDCESPAVPVWVGPWLDSGFMVPHLYSVKNIWMYLTPHIKNSAIALFLRQKLHIWAKLNSINM